MKTIKDLTVQVTYTAGLGNVNVSNKVMRGINKIQDEYHGKIDLDTDTSNDDEDITAAIDWLRSKINEEDAYEFEYEIIDCE